MDWTVNDSLYHCFLKWKLKCENILECELAALPEPQQCKKLIAWSGDFRMDQYMSWGLTKDELELEKIWSWFEEFCKPQSKEVPARFDLLTSFHQGSKVWMDGTTVYKARSIWQNTHLRLPKSCIGTSSGFTCMMKILCPRPLMKAV